MVWFGDPFVVSVHFTVWSMSAFPVCSWFPLITLLLIISPELICVLVDPLLPDQEGVLLCYCSDYEVLSLVERLTEASIIAFINAI